MKIFSAGHRYLKNRYQETKITDMLALSNFIGINDNSVT